MKKMFGKFFMNLMAVIAMWLGASGSVLMAAGTLQTDAAETLPESGQAKPNGINDGGGASVTNGQQGSPEQYETDLETTILKLDPYNTVLLTLMSDAKMRQIHSQEFEYSSVGPRIIRTTVKTGVEAGSSDTDRQVVAFDDKGFCMKDDTIRFVGVKGNDGKSDLMCIVIEKDGSGQCSVYAKNGFGTNGFALPNIPSGTTVIRMGKSCSESKAQTSRANAAPTTEKGCVQNFMLQIEQTAFDKMTDKRVPWDFDDIVDWNMRDYKITKELTYWFGVGGLDRHEANFYENNYTMTGIWWQAGRDIEIGHVVTNQDGSIVWEDGPNGETAVLGSTLTNYKVGSTNGQAVTSSKYYYAVDEEHKIAEEAVAKVEIDGKDLVRFSKSAFLGNGGSQTKHMMAGANVVEAFDNIKGKQYERKDIVTEGDLTVQNFKTSFGVIKLIYQKLFDVCGMANAAFLLDKAYLRGVWFQSLNRTVLKLKETGQRNSHGVVLQEVNAIYLQYADCHARVWLSGRRDVYDFHVASKYDTQNQSTVNPPKWGAGNFATVGDRQKHDLG